MKLKSHCRWTKEKAFPFYVQHWQTAMHGSILAVTIPPRPPPCKRDPAQPGVGNCVDCLVPRVGVGNRNAWYRCGGRCAHAVWCRAGAPGTTRCRQALHKMFRIPPGRFFSAVQYHMSINSQGKLKYIHELEAFYI